jgi:uncharacterized protein YkwD
MGLADRDYTRRAQASRRRRLPNLVGIACIVALVAAGAFLPAADGGSTQRLSPRNDPWIKYLAPESACPDGQDRSAARAAEQRTMLCLVNWARRRHGLRPLTRDPVLSAAARLKAEDIRRCRDFSHRACGRAAYAVARQAGYRGSWGENLYWGQGELGRARIALSRWLISPRHRENLLRDHWTKQGIALQPVESFNGRRHVALWVSHFGDR